ncbi:GGDEF domain-containing protein [Geodermatophilaceae bacterium NBWT11]|nr:GGDEF domain-containing protein [Geodermatophilaceae bacterium NBWT11]
MAAFMLLGAAAGSVNLVVAGVLRDGAPRGVYAATMALLAVLGLWFIARPRAGVRSTFALVLLGDLVYVVVAASVADPLRHATPLMMLFAAFVAAWFLDAWMLGVHMAVVPFACWSALAPSFTDAPGLGVQVLVNAGMLDVAAFGVFVLRRRVQGLLAATEALSSTDPLTGLANRRSLVTQSERLWRQAHRGGDHVVALVLDLDHFKQLNDTHGHATGDAVLRAVAQALRAVVRPTDVLARIGGEELVVVGLAADRTEAHRLGERLRSAVRQAWVDHPGVTASIGIALDRPSSDTDPAAGVWRLVDRADAAMYEAKQAGRDRVELAPPLVPLPRAAHPVVRLDRPA